MATHYKGEVLPFRCYFEDRFGRPYEVEQLWKSEEDINVSRLTVLKENSRIGLQFYVDEREVHDSEAVCKIQTNIYDSSDEQVVFNHPLQVGRGRKKWLYQANDNEEFPWRMGVYFIEVFFGGERYVGGINILPHHLDESQVRHLHEYLNEQVQDIIYDFVYSNKTLSNDEGADLPKYWYYDYARKIAEIYDEYMYCMTAIERNPHDYIQTSYKPSVRAGKIDHKSIRWASSNKGLAKNAGVQQSNFQLNKKKIRNFDSKENRWLKNILLMWRKDLLEVSSYIENDLDSYQRKLKEQQDKHNKVKQEKGMLLAKSDTGENTKKDIKSQMYMLEKDIKKTRTKVSILNEQLGVLEKMESKLIFFLDNSFLRDVERGFRKPFLKKNQYFRVDAIFEELRKIRENKGEDTQMTPILKPTWQIYEYFCLFKVVKTFTDKGFEIVQGIDDDVLNLYFEDRIQEGTKFVLENEEKTVHLWYDHYHPHTEEEAIERGEYFYTNLAKKKPDLKIDVFKKTEDGKLFDTSIVMDAKFSQLRNIYNSQYMNKTTEQLTEYYSFFSVLEEAGFRACVDRVVCLYAGAGTQEVQKRLGVVTYLRFHPEIDEDGPRIVGEEELKGILSHI
ncbi:DUF2357 domain-containing protein [Salinicoccus siamensis]|uniref:DUF2357 domain-containing protein n=1 Tax=Salinicoccus siamensis TaxID=381830 RepID=A0ABV5Z0H3_9STAP